MNSKLQVEKEGVDKLEKPCMIHKKRTVSKKSPYYHKGVKGQYKSFYDLFNSIVLVGNAGNKLMML